MAPLAVVRAREPVKVLSVFELRHEVGHHDVCGACFHKKFYPKVQCGDRIHRPRDESEWKVESKYLPPGSDMFSVTLRPLGEKDGERTICRHDIFRRQGERLRFPVKTPEQIALERAKRVQQIYEEFGSSVRIQDLENHGGIALRCFEGGEAFARQQLAEWIENLPSDVREEWGLSGSPDALDHVELILRRKEPLPQFEDE